MPRSRTKKGSDAPTRRDAIRIVPLHRPETPLASTVPAAAPGPHLLYGGGPVLGSVEVFDIFWGAAWRAALSGTVLELNRFLDEILVSPLMDQLGEYGVPGRAIAHGKRTGSVMIPRPGRQASVQDRAIRRMLQKGIASNPAFPPPGPETLYFVFLEPGVAVVMGGGRSCQAFCGYHDAIDDRVFYAVVPYPGCAGCDGGLAPFDALTSTASHELCEAITDPIPGRGWYDARHGEIADICAWKTRKIGGFTVQLGWSNAGGRCV